MSLILVTLSGCRWFVKPIPEPQPYLVDEILGSYSYDDSSDSYSGKLVLRSIEDKLAVDIFGPMYFLAAAIRHSNDSTLVYLTLQSELLILPPDGNLPFEGWELPISALYQSYSNTIPSDPDSVIEIEDTVIIYADNLIYCIDNESQRLMSMQGENWKLVTEGILHRSEDKLEPPQKIMFYKDDAQLIFTFDYLEVNERDPHKAFDLNVPDGVEIIDYR